MMTTGSPPHSPAVSRPAHDRGSAVPVGPPRPRWYRPGRATLLAATAGLYLWNLGGQGYTNPFYAAAVWASTRSPIAWLFAAVDAPGAITVDKPPADNWLMGLSARLFGFSTWSMLVPQALLGVATVALLVATVRRWSGPAVALGAGALMALTPVAVVMFRFDDPDPMLTFLLVAAAYALVRGVGEAGSRSGTGWVAAAGALVGLGFLAKMGAALLVVPAFALTHLVVADTPLRRRVGQLLGAGVALVVSAGWYVALVSLWPAGSRPWIGGSPDNSLLQLAVGYNGLARILGRDHGAGPAGPTFAGSTPGSAPGAHHHFGGGHGFGGSPGFDRLFSTQFGGQIAWLLPAALAALVVLLWLTRRAPRQDRLRAATLLWGGWLVTSAALFSFMAGTIHPYYTVVMVPALAALVAIGVREAVRHRERLAARGLLAAGVAGTAAWSAVLLHRTPGFLPWLTPVVLAAGVLAAVAVLTPAVHVRRVGVLLASGCALVACLGGGTAYAIDTVVSPHGSTQASAGPPVVGRFGPGGDPAHLRPGHAGGRGDADQIGPQLADRLRQAGTQWSAATPTTRAAAGLELASGTSVLGVGGFSGSDPFPTLAGFQADVLARRVHYYIDRPDRPGHQGARGPAGGFGGRGFGGRGGGPAVTSIRDWVRAHFTPTTIGGVTVYDLTAAPH